MGWSDEDQAKALAWQVEDADRCSGCGTQSYEADLVSIDTVVCRVCKDLELQRARTFDMTPPKQPGKKFFVKRGENGK